MNQAKPLALFALLLMSAAVQAAAQTAVQAAVQTAAQAASKADTQACAAPVFPNYSTSNHEIRRVAREVKHFRACQDAAALTADVAQINRQTAQVEAGLETWLAATLDYSQGQRALQRPLSFVDIDRIERGQAPRAEPRPMRRLRPAARSDPPSAPTF
ncbi:hypothetical protein [Massilia sp. TWP1-3-3]|uniref:hypothetical protein n=1 Tax=Massilia sp. TWP1-3-3 TaxID=2804573 RepID=UPI003CE96B79